MSYSPRALSAETVSATALTHQRQFIPRVLRAVGALLCTVTFTLSNSDPLAAAVVSHDALFGRILASLTMLTSQGAVMTAIPAHLLNVVANRFHWFPQAFGASTTIGAAAAGPPIVPTVRTVTLNFSIPLADLRSNWNAPDGEVYSGHIADYTIAIDPRTVCAAHVALTCTAIGVNVTALERDITAPFLGAARSIRRYAITDARQLWQQGLVTDAFLFQTPAPLAGNSPVIVAQAGSTISLRKGGVLTIENAALAAVSQSAQGMDDPDYIITTAQALMLTTRSNRQRMTKLELGNIEVNNFTAPWTAGTEIAWVYIPPLNSGDVASFNDYAGGVPLAVPGPDGTTPPNMVPVPYVKYLPLTATQAKAAQSAVRTAIQQNLPNGVQTVQRLG